MTGRLHQALDKQTRAKGSAFPLSGRRGPVRMAAHAFVPQPDTAFSAAERSFDFKTLSIQPKLTVSQPNNVYEQEADRVADQVMRMPDPVVQRKPG